MGDDVKLGLFLKHLVAFDGTPHLQIFPKFIEGFHEVIVMRDKLCVHDKYRMPDFTELQGSLNWEGHLLPEGSEPEHEMADDLPDDAVLAIRISDHSFNVSWNCYEPSREEWKDVKWNVSLADWDSLGAYVDYDQSPARYVRVARCYRVDVTFLHNDLTQHTVPIKLDNGKKKWVQTVFAQITGVEAMPWKDGIRAEFAMEDSILLQRCPRQVKLFGGISNTQGVLNYQTIDVRGTHSVAAYRGVERQLLQDEAIDNLSVHGVDAMSSQRRGRASDTKVLSAGGGLESLRRLHKFIIRTEGDALVSTDSHKDWMESRSANYKVDATGLTDVYPGLRSGGPITPASATAAGLTDGGGDDADVETSLHATYQDFSAIMSLVTQLYNMSQATSMPWSNAAGVRTRVLRDMEGVTKAKVEFRIEELNRYCYPAGLDNRTQSSSVHVAMLLLSDLRLEQLMMPSALNVAGACSSLLLRCVAEPGPGVVPWGTPIGTGVDFRVSVGSSEITQRIANVAGTNEAYFTYLLGGRTPSEGASDGGGDCGDIILPLNHAAGQAEFHVHYWLSRYDAHEVQLNRKVGLFKHIKGMYLCEGAPEGQGGNDVSVGFLRGWWVPTTENIVNGSIVTILRYLGPPRAGDDSDGSLISATEPLSALAHQVGAWIAPRLLSGKYLDNDEYGETGAPDPLMIRSFLESPSVQGLELLGPRDLAMLYMVTAYSTIDRTLAPEAWPLMPVMMLGKHAKENADGTGGRLTKTQKAREAEFSDSGGKYPTLGADKKERRLAMSYYKYDIDDVRDPDGADAIGLRLADWASWHMLVAFVHMEGWRSAGWGLSIAEQTSVSYGMTPNPSLIKAIIGMIRSDDMRDRYATMPAGLEELGDRIYPKAGDGVPVFDSLFIRGGKDGRNMAEVLQLDGYSICGPVLTGGTSINMVRNGLHDAFDDDINLRNANGVYSFKSTRQIVNKHAGSKLPTFEDHTVNRFPQSSYLQSMSDSRLYDAGNNLLTRMNQSIRSVRLTELPFETRAFLGLMEEGVNVTTQDHDSLATAQALGAITVVVKMLSKERQLKGKPEEFSAYILGITDADAPKLGLLQKHLKRATTDEFGSGVTVAQAYEHVMTTHMAMSAGGDGWDFNLDS